jgi:hypothetical protein
MSSLCKDVSKSDYIASSIGSLLNNKHERIWKETFLSNLRYFVDIYLEGWGKNHKNISQDSRCSDRESKRVKCDSFAAWVKRTYYTARLQELLPLFPLYDFASSWIFRLKNILMKRSVKPACFSFVDITKVFCTKGQANKRTLQVSV